MKKLLVGLLTAACAASAAFSLTACGNDGRDGINGKDGIDGEDGKNGTNGEDGKDGVGIKEVKFDDDGNMTVILTDDTTKNLGKIPYCSHSFSYWKTQMETTCTSIGYGTHECENCGYTEYQFTAAAGHTWDDGEEFAGKILKTCTVCYATQIEEKPVVKEPPIVEPPVVNVQFVLPVENAEISKKYGFGLDATLDRYVAHKGMDFKCAEGTSVKAVLDGTVIKVVRDHILNENYVTITHKDGMTTTYKYIVVSADLKEGDEVKQGDIIGTVAEAGGMEMNDGEHLHFELSANGETVAPEEYFNPDDLVYADGVE